MYKNKIYTLGAGVLRRSCVQWQDRVRIHDPFIYKLHELS